MNKKIKLLAGGLSIALISVVGSGYLSDYVGSKKIEEQRKKHAEFLKNSPYKKSLTWDKKTRKLKGLPPNRYFEQMWELSINPATGRLDDGKITKVREDLINKRASRKSPGEEGNSWVERGPNNIGGRTRVILFDPNDATNNTVYAGGVSGGLWKNTNISNANSQWARVEGVPGNLSVTSISVDPRNSNTWYIGTGEQYTAGDVVGNGVYVSTNAGTTWTALTIPPAGGGNITYNANNIFLSGIHFVNDIVAWDNGTTTELYVAVGAHRYGDAGSPSNWLGLQSAGLYRSTDSGSTWSRIESSNMSYVKSAKTYYYIPNDLEVGADNKLWMGTIKSALGEGGGRIFGSTNGATWTEAAASPLTESNRVEIEPSATNGNKLYVLAQGTTTTTPVRIFKTTNGFTSVTTSSLPNDVDTGIAAKDFCRGQAFYDLVIEADPSNDNILYVGGIDLFKSTNGASSWSQLSHWYGGFGQSNNVHADQHSIAFGNNSSSKMLFGNDGGVYYTGNSGSTISSRNKGYNVTQFVKAAIGPDGAGDTAGIFSAGAQDNGTQAFRNATAGINSSTDLSDGDGFYTFVDKDGQYMIATYIRNVIYRFSLPWNGKGRQQGGATTLFDDSDTTGDFVNPMGFDSDANRLLSNKSTDSSNAILSINVAANSNGTLTNSLLTAKPTAFRASPFANNAWYAGLADGNLVKLTNVTNSSATWTNVVTPFVGSISSIRFGETSNDIFVTIHNYGVTNIWATSDGGSNWVNKEGNLPNIPVRDFLQNPLSRNEAIIATQLGVWSTSNFNETNPSWSQAYNGMSDVSVTSLDYWNVSGDHTQNKIIASTYGRGVFTGKFTETVVIDTEAPSVPSSLAASSITSSSLTLNWTAASDNVAVTGYDVYQGTTKLGTATGISYNVTGLTASTAYTFSVKAKDAAGNVSSASNTVSTTTPAVQINYCASSGNTSYATGVTRVVFGSIDKADGPAKNVGYEDFTSLSTTVSQSSSENLTVSVNTDGNYRVDAIAWIDWNQDGDFADSGETYDLGKISNVSNGALPTKAVAVPANAKVGNTRMRISARYNANPTSCQTNFDGEVEDYTVNITAVVADTTAPLITLNGSATMNLTVGESFTDPGATASDNVDGNLTSSIVVTGNVNTSSVGTYTLNYNVSDAAGNAATQVSRTVTVNADTQAPTVPSNATVSSITQTTATISWTASTDNVAVTEYDVYQGATKLGSTANTTMNITSLTAATGYTFSVKAKDAAGNVSASSNVVNVTTLSNVVSYCDSKGTRVTYEWIDYVSFGGMTNTTAANGGYGDFTSKVANVALGSTNQLVVSAGFSSTAYNEHFTVWIDYNRDGDFTDAGEQVTTGNSSSAANRTADIVIPSTATLGQTRMRVSMKYDAVSTSCEANLGDGEVEDYTVNITAAPVVAVVADISGESIGNQEVLNLMTYPNPAINNVKVKLASKSTNMTYKIVNVIGRVVQSGHLDAAGLNVSNLNTGMYILEVNDGQKLLTTKLMKK